MLICTNLILKEKNLNFPDSDTIVVAPQIHNFKESPTYLTTPNAPSFRDSKQPISNEDFIHRQPLTPSDIFSCTENAQECPPHSSRLKIRTDKSARILVSIVVLFLLAHSYRMAIKAYEIASPNAHTIEKFKMCFALKR